LEPFLKFANQIRLQSAKRHIKWAALGKKILPQDFSEAVKNHDDSPIRTKLLWGITQTLRRTPGTAP